MNTQERWTRVLEAHAEEHRAMRERGLSRVNVLGRPPMRRRGRGRGPAMMGVGAITDRGVSAITDREVWSPTMIIMTGVALAAAVLWFASWKG